MNKFSKFQIASFKRVALNVHPLVKRKEKLMNQIETINNELNSIQIQIDGYQTPVKEATGGYTTEDLFYKEVVVAGTDKNGKQIKSTVYKLKYPDTIIPVQEENQEENIAQDTEENINFGESFEEETASPVVNSFGESQDEVTID